ncbi:DSD1 family PLP-dependent enzyme [Schlesneria paludicola]|uniref:DSD1 family PLP-dependent enzyme n=1 Tax=Schlesneria paludicola TaxID=360056 RepID=UPI000299F676|nr:DSD1 family PLP-dependent enzyme [Schlesneria paludicola]
MAGIAAPSTPDPRIGLTVDELDTPTLLLDRQISDRNLARMADFFKNRPAKLRPHFKNHKCVTLARRQMAAGAVGMTCAKLGEAEILVAHEFTNVLVANQVVGEPKIARLVRLAKQARVAVAIDHVEQALAISKAAAAAGVNVDLLIEVDIGMGRCGIPCGDPALELARRIVDLPGIRFAGLQAFEGHLVNVVDRAERTAKARAAMQLAVDTRRLIEAAGIPVGCISGCSSATYDITGVMDGVDEVQAGTYATMDRQYHRLIPEFEIALSVLVRVISRPAPQKAVLDIGVKGAGGEFGVPAIRGFPDIEVPFFLAEEHVVIQKAPDWKIGQVLHLIPSHACTTCNLYREIVVHENGRVVEVWPIEASGQLS